MIPFAKIAGGMLSSVPGLTDYLQNQTLTPQQEWRANYYNRGAGNALNAHQNWGLPQGTGGGLAKKGAWTVKITVLSKDYKPSGEADAVLQREDVIGAAC